MLFVVRFFLAFLTVYFYGRIIYCIFCSSKDKNDIISKFHSFFLGLGITSISFWFYTIATNGFNSNYHIVELLVVVIIYLYVFFKSKKKKKNNISHQSLCDSSEKNVEASSKKERLRNIEIYKDKKNVLDYVALVLFILIAFLCFVRCIRYPDGRWDAIAMWNFKAKFLATGNELWSGMFSDYYDYNHCDYPLFLSCMTARFYIYTHKITNTIPMFFSWFFSISCFLLPYFYLKKIKNNFFAVFSICLLSFSPNMIYECSKQYSDMPLAIFFFFSIYELIIWERFKSKSLPWLCVIFSSLCLWIKNEGIPWFLFYSIFVGYYIYKKFWGKFNKGKVSLYRFFNLDFIKKLICLLLCVIPALLSFISVRYLANKENELIVGVISRFGQFLLWKRYSLIMIFIIEFFKKHLWILVIPIYLLLGFIDKKYKNNAVLLLVIVFMGIGYLSLYILTPYNLLWHLDTSFPRIVTHFLPSLAFLGCLLFDFKRDK